MVAGVRSPRRVAKKSLATERAGYIPITSGPVRELTEEDFDLIDARIDALQRDAAETLGALKALNARTRRV